MNKFLAAEKANGTKLFFVFDEDFDGLLSYGDMEEQVPFWSYISRSNDVYLLNDTAMQRELSSMRWDDEKWVRKFCGKQADFILAINKMNSEMDSDSKKK